MLSKMCLQKVTSLGKAENLMQCLRINPELLGGLTQFGV